MLKSSVSLLVLLLIAAIAIIGCGSDAAKVIPDPPSPSPSVDPANLSVISGYLYLDPVTTNRTGLVTSESKKNVILCDEPHPDLEPVENATIHCNGQQTQSNQNGEFELPEENGEHEIIIDPSSSDNAGGCPPVKTNCSAKNKNSDNPAVDFKVVPVNRTVPNGHTKDWELNFFDNNNQIVDNPEGAVWSVELFENYPIVGTITQTGLFTATTPGEGTIQVIWNGLVRTAHVRVLRGDGSDTYRFFGNVSIFYDIIVGSQTNQPVEGAFVSALGIETGAFTDPNGNYSIDGIPIPPDTIIADASYQTYTQQQTAAATQPATEINFVFTETITITPTPTNTPVIDPNTVPTNPPTSTPTPAATPVPTSTTIPTGTPTSTPTETPVPTPTNTPTPGWHDVSYSGASGDYLNDVQITNGGAQVNIVSADHYYRSLDYGVTYSDTQPSTISGMRSIYFCDNNTGWIVGNLGLLYKSVNGGNSWSAQNSSNGDTLFCVFFLDANNGWISGTKSTAQFSTNGGTGWTNRVTSPGFQDNNRGIEFINMNTGWTVGTNGRIYKTTNQAVSWSLLTPTTVTLTGIDMIDINTGWVVGNTGTILKTINSGASWTSQTSGVSDELRAVSFYDSQNGWAVGRNGVALQTTNGGSSWNNIPTGVITDLNSVHCLGPNEAWAVGANGTIIHYY